MKKKNTKKIILISVLLLLITIFFSNNVVVAEINQEYYGQDPVNSTLVDDAVSGSTVLTWIAKLIYAVAGLLEKILGNAFQMLTGTNDFPWADKIVFNAVPMLDVNFINPSEGSFVGNPKIYELIQNVYETILALAISFFGIAVMITAIKLVISTIASEKAKYKKAVVDWVVGFVLLFCIHFGISLMFYVNEQLVVVASKIAMGNYKVAEQAYDKLISDSIKTLKNNVGNARYGDSVEEIIGNPAVGPNEGKLISDIIEENQEIVETYLNLKTTDDSTGIYEMLMKYNTCYTLALGQCEDNLITKWGQYQNLAMIISWAAEENISVKRLKQIYDGEIIQVTWRTDDTLGWDYGGQAISRENFDEIFGDHKYEVYAWLAHHDTLISFDNTGPKKVAISCGKNHCSDNYLLTLSSGVVNDWGYELKDGQWLRVSDGGDYSGFASHVGWFNVDDIDLPFHWDDVISDLIKLKSVSPTANYGEDGYNSGSGGATNAKLFSNLSSFFKFNAYERELIEAEDAGTHDGVTAISVDKDKPQIQNMLMYAILLGQSVVLFISYIKRLFYVILLSLMAPVVVVFDFFQKFGK